jgi:ketosteroid isomerase-like protein
MTSNAARAVTLMRALQAGLEGDKQVLLEVFTEDVRAWTPTLCTRSLVELIGELDRSEEAFSDVEIEATPLDVGGDHACVEWSLALTHSGPLRVDDETVIEPTGMRVALHGITVAEFHGERICSLRQYWDDSTLLDQVGARRHV